MTIRDPSLAAILSQRGMVVRIATACGLRPSAVSQWTRVPTRHLRAVSDLVGVPVDQLVPADPNGTAAREAAR